MKALSLLCLTLALAPLAPAELEYVEYDLVAKTADPVTNPDVTDPVYHSGSKILFVRDPTLPDQSYYIGVFELTCDQARQLKLALSTTSGGWAYGEFTPSSSSTLPANLHFPTHAEWKAYTDDPATLSADAKKSLNIYGGVWYRRVSLKDWYEQYLCASPSKLSQNSHGVYDIYGNVAEYATDGKGTGPFYGGSAHDSDRIEHLAEDSADNLRNDGKPASRYSRTHQGVRLIYRAPAEQLYTLSVTLDGADVTQNVVTTDPADANLSALKVGTAITVTAPKPEGQRRLSGREVTGLDPSTLLLEALDAPLTFDMPASDVTIAYTSEPYATLTVTNGTATVNDQPVTEVEAGDVVTLTHDALGDHQTFLGWTCPGGITLDDDNSFTVPHLQGGEHYAFTANIRTYPRVLVFGGSVSDVSNGYDYGDGYYAPGTSLTLQASAPEGYVLDGWTYGSQRVPSPYPVPADTYDVTITLTATYTRDESSEPTVTPADIHLGSTKTDSGYQAHSLFGWTPATAETTLPDVDGNRYHFYDYVNAGLFAILPLTGNDRTIVYQEAVSSTENPAPQAPTAPQMPNIAGLPLNQREPALEAYYTELEQYQQELAAYQKAVDAWRASASTTTTLNTERLLLRRVSPTTEGKRDFYLGVYETPIGNIANLEKLTFGKTDYDKTASGGTDHTTQVFCARTLLDLKFPIQDIPDFAAYLTQLNTAFKVNARFPTQEDVLAVGDHSASENAGEGYGLDPDLEDSMVVNGGSRSQLVAADGMTVDPYGFYGLWGNCWEASSNEVGFGGAAVFGNKNSCLTDMTSDRYGIGAQQYLSLRPVIDVEEAVVIYIGQESTATAVQVAPGQRLFADDTKPTKAGHRFTGWTLGGGSIGTDHVVTEADDGKVLVANWEPLPEHPDSVTVACTDCLGPVKAYPGQSVTVYPPEGRTFVAAAPLTIEPAGIATVSALNEDGTVTVTFASPLPSGGTVTLQGNLADPPAPPKPGYRFRLR